MSKVSYIIKRVFTWVLSSFFTVAALFVAVNVLGGNSVADSVSFLVRMVKHPATIGAVAPSSSAASMALIGKVPSFGVNRKFIEIGAGTGAVTKEFVKILKPGDHLDVVELDDDLAAILYERFGDNPQVSIVHASILDWKPEYQYDAMVMAIPFNALPHSLTKDIWLHCRSLVKPGAPVSYISYLGLPQVRGFFLRGDERNDYLANRQFMNEQFGQYGVGLKEVLANLPPAEILYLQF